jgi:serine/threonine-protein kinase
MSPEQVQGHAVDGRADQFSLAVIAYEILTGEKPFLADQMPALLFRIVREDPVPPQRLNPTIGPQVETVLRKALAKAASDRYRTCSEFLDELSRALEASPGWHPLPRSAAENMPTLANVPVEPLRRGTASGQPVVPAPPPPMSPASSIHDSPRLLHAEEPEPRNPILKSLVWMLVGIGLVGLVLFGAQKYVFNRSTEPAPVIETVSPPAASAPAKPSPVGQSQTPDTVSKQTDPAPPPQTTAPEKRPARGARDETDDEPTPDRARASTAPAKPGFEQSVQFLTDPPGAEVIIDGDSSHACKTPCMISLASGRHALNVQLAGYRPFPRVFSVPQDSDIFLQLAKLTGTLSITSEPPGAAIDLDGAAQTKRTPAVFNLTPGTYHVKVSRSGAFIDFDVQVRDGEFINKRVDF